MQTLAMNQPVAPTQSPVHDTWTVVLPDTLSGRKPDGMFAQAILRIVPRLGLYLDGYHAETVLDPIWSKVQILMPRYGLCHPASQSLPRLYALQAKPGHLPAD